MIAVRLKVAYCCCTEGDCVGGDSTRSREKHTSSLAMRNKIFIWTVGTSVHRSKSIAHLTRP